jgi:hypothetical protein
MEIAADVGRHMELWYPVLTGKHARENLITHRIQSPAGGDERRNP